MAPIRYCLMLLALLFVHAILSAQNIFYPTNASQALQATAVDVAALLQKATHTSINALPYTQWPTAGIIFQYNNSIANNQACIVKNQNNGSITFEAAEDNGLIFGAYQYLHQLGFRFYQPGTIWEVIPTLSNAFIPIDTVYTCQYKYKTWFISGGHNNWVMDKSTQYNWDAYFGQNGHEWALYQRRNGMLGTYRFTGHRGDIMQGNYLQTLRSNPCYVAPYNGSREANVQSVPDVNNSAAIQLWSNAIQNQHINFSTTILSNIGIYPNIYRSYKYNYNNIGIEVPDGAHWANTLDANGCSGGNLLSESDQHIKLANATATSINSTLPALQFQAYAYDTHANVPSNGVAINNNIDIQVVPTAFQFETSAKGLLNRWYSKTNNISEYHYLNILQWSGETPSVYLQDIKNTLQRIKDKNSQGIVWEASPAKFASLPYLLAANNFLLYNTAIDSTLLQFCTAMFGNAASTIYTLLQAWGKDEVLNLNNGIQDNKYKIPYYLQLLQQADAATSTDNTLVQQRIFELKAYLHYMVLYYNWAFNQQSNASKIPQAAALCLYAAKANQLKIINSYFLINDIVSKYQSTDSMYVQYNVATGSAYKNGALPLLTNAEIQQNYLLDIQAIATLIPKYTFNTAATIISKFAENNLQPLPIITAKINYTQGKDYTHRSEFYVAAPAAGSFTIQYTPAFDMPLKGNINFTVEDVAQPLVVIKDITVHHQTSYQPIVVQLPAAGTYKLSIVTKYKAALQIQIQTNGNYFYKQDAYLGNTIENYRSNLKSLPGYFYVPAGINMVYFSVNNSNPGGTGFATPLQINNAFNFVDATNNTLLAALVSTADSALFAIALPNNTNGQFIKANKMEQYRMCIANTSNHYWYATPKPCGNTNFTCTVATQQTNCTIQATAVSNNNYTWQVNNNGKISTYNTVSSIQIQALAAGNITVALVQNKYCATTKNMVDDIALQQALLLCNTATYLGQTSPMVITVYPNPSVGHFNIAFNNKITSVQQISIYNSTGKLMANFAKTAHFNISYLPAGVYLYKMLYQGVLYKGQVIKN